MWEVIRKVSENEKLNRLKLNNEIDVLVVAVVERVILVDTIDSHLDPSTKLIIF